ncbi:MAG: intradiol ring-cleavage dioxygenase [Flavobacterium sp.]|nr:MAG: intradiol ring-cleavage dioxygenase [Flavobacterium sp.]
MRAYLSVFLLAVLLSSCTNAQQKIIPKLVGAPCEGCEAVFEYGDQKLTNTDTLPDFNKEGTKIKVEGIIYEKDGKTPANNVILYVYHTDLEGLYTPAADAEGWARNHGDNRTWLKTNKDGRYAFYTIKPAPYPTRSEPAHIHYEILEPNGKYYYLQSCYFEGDSLLTSKQINPESPRGGTSGVLRLKKEGNLWVGTRDIILGKNIPGYE